MKRILAAVVTALGLPILLTGAVFASSVYPTGSRGVDVSYPNCSSSIPAVSFGIVGITGGLVYSHNSCAAAEAGHFPSLSNYVNTGLNTSSKSAYYAQAQAGCNGDVACADYHYGYNAAEDAITYANSQGLTTHVWWLDVETSNTWSSDPLQNRQSLQGEYDALIANSATTVGIYSTTAQWQGISGSWLNNWPSWGATTWTTAAQAQTYCTGHQFTAGPSLLMQFKSRQSRLDQDVAC